MLERYSVRNNFLFIANVAGLDSEGKSTKWKLLVFLRELLFVNYLQRSTVLTILKYKNIKSTNSYHNTEKPSYCWYNQCIILIWGFIPEFINLFLNFQDKLSYTKSLLLRIVFVIYYSEIIRSNRLVLSKVRCCTSNYIHI